MRHRFLNWRYQANALIENWLPAILKNRDSGLLAQRGLASTNLLQDRAAPNLRGPTIVEVLRVAPKIELSSDTNGRLDDLIRSQPNDTRGLLPKRCLSVTDAGLRRLLRFL